MESIRSVPGVGSKMAERFAILGIRTLEDMISFMPRSYDDRTQERMIADTTEENPTAICRIYSICRVSMWVPPWYGALSVPAAALPPGQLVNKYFTPSGRGKQENAPSELLENGCRRLSP